MGDSTCNTSEKRIELPHWISIEEAAKRLGRHPGHLRKLAPALQARGLARKVKTGKTCRSWQFRSDFQIDGAASQILLPDYGAKPIVISAGDHLITLETTGPARVVIETTTLGKK